LWEVIKWVNIKSEEEYKKIKYLPENPNIKFKHDWVSWWYLFNDSIPDKYPQTYSEWEKIIEENKITNLSIYKDKCNELNLPDSSELYSGIYPEFNSWSFDSEDDITTF
jgi:hypothetical protein